VAVIELWDGIAVTKELKGTGVEAASFLLEGWNGKSVGKGVDKERELSL
jgi:hypothetical protein